MDPLSITVGSLQIVSLCAQSTVALAQWVGDVKTVDERIGAFSTEINALSATYEALLHSLRSPAMLRAARASEYSSGGQLWRQIASLIKDRENTMVILNQILGVRVLPLGMYSVGPADNFAKVLSPGI